MYVINETNVRTAALNEKSKQKLCCKSHPDSIWKVQAQIKHSARQNTVSCFTFTKQIRKRMIKQMKDDMKMVSRAASCILCSADIRAGTPQSRKAARQNTANMEPKDIRSAPVSALQTHPESDGTSHPNIR